MADALVHAEKHGHVLLIRINRPNVRNAFNMETAEAMERCIDALEADPELRVGVITGSADCFSAGVDLKAAATGKRPCTERRGWFGLFQCPPDKPLVAAVEGPALAGGCELALACDLIVASRASTFGLPEVKRGLIASAGGLFRLPRRLPRNVAMEMALTGNPQTAERMYALGMVNVLCEPGTAADTAMAFAETIAVNAPVSVVATKRVINVTATLTEEAAWPAQLPVIEEVRKAEDYQEGLRAFAEKRAPVWKGR